MSLRLPLDISKGSFNRNNDDKTAVDRFLDLLLFAPQQESPVNPDFGFIFNNLRFEIFNEREGVVFNSSDDDFSFDGIPGLYEKKISGSSKNLNTFASELRDAILKYEKRLSDVTTSMTYIREERLIYVNVKGIFAETGKPYNYNTTIKVWK